MRFYVNLNDNAVTQSASDHGTQAEGWTTTTEAAESVQVQFHRDGVPELLPANTPMLLGVKPFGQYSLPTYLTYVGAWAAPTDASGYYTAILPTATVAINLALGSTDGGVTPGDLDTIPRTTCEIEWFANGAAALPTKSRKFSVVIENTPNRDNVAPMVMPGAYPSSAALRNVVANAYRNYPAEIAGTTDALLAGKTPIYSNLAGTGTQNFFSVYDGTAHTYTRNPACIVPRPSWASVWNSANADGTGGNRGCVVMVTPTEGLTNQHFAAPYAVGVRHDFLGTDGVTYYALVQSSVQVGTTDWRIVTFDRALPAAVGVALTLTAAQTAAVLTVGTPVFSAAQDHVARVNEFVADSVFVSLRAATAANRTAWTRAAYPAVTGDSDQPSWVRLDGRDVLLTTWSGGQVNPSYGVSLAANAAAINALLTGGSLQTLPLNLLPAGVALAGDLGGTNTAPKVVGLQGIPVSATAPTAGQVPTFNGTQIVFQTPTGGGSVNGQPISPSSLSVSGASNFQGSATFYQLISMGGYIKLGLGGYGTPDGYGNPNGKFTADSGSLYTDNAYGGTGVWYKASGSSSTNTGWVQVLTSANGVTSVNGQTGPVSGAQAVAGADIAPNKVTTAFVVAPSGANSLAIGDYSINAYGNGLAGWANFVAGNLTAIGSLAASAPSKLGVCTLSGLPTASAYNGATATVTNPAAGKSMLVTSNGTNWLYQDGSTAA